MQYLGSLIVKRLHGQQSAEEACLKLRVSWQACFTEYPLSLS